MPLKYLIALIKYSRKFVYVSGHDNSENGNMLIRIRVENGKRWYVNWI